MNRKILFGRSVWVLFAVFVCLCPSYGFARQLEVPLHLEQGLLQDLLAEQIYTEGRGEARVLDDGKGCNKLILSDPVLDFENGSVRTRTAAQARLGTPLGERCLSMISWNGFIEIFQEPVMGSDADTVEFRVVDSRVYSRDGESQGVLGTLWEWIKKFVHPRFNRLQLQLSPVLEELREILVLVFPKHNLADIVPANTVAINSIGILDERIQIDIRFDVPVIGMTSFPGASGVAEPPLSEQELARWERSWQQWDAFLTTVIKQAGADADVDDMRSGLLSVLLDARQDLTEVLVSSTGNAPDTVPGLFIKTWKRLAPELRRLHGSLPYAAALHYLEFITAADALVAIRSVEQQTGFVLSADALRRMARMLAPSGPGDPLRYEVAVDPKLRTLFGFGPPLAISSTNTANPEARAEGMPGRIQITGGWSPVMMLFMPLLIVQDSSYHVLVEQLNGVVPTITMLDEYLPRVKQLLDQVIQTTVQEKKLDLQFIDLFRDMVLATAWQESCWRQYVMVKGEVAPIGSHAGAIGIMQINQHVWRGFYDIERLKQDVGYNARAGSEILHHYLVGYAISKGEHKRAGGEDNLPRAAYAMYNGGPGHMTRYRDEGTSASLRSIDSAFWEKFESVRSGNTLAVAECYR